MKWEISRAKQSFSELVHSAKDEPQLIYEQNELVAAVISPDELRELQEYRESSRHRPSLAEAAARVRQVVLETGEELEIPPRTDRPNAFIEVLDSLE
jgi:PHD/YefM family antitoxin component YafN of YafNO toxin-antitoxin module